MTIARRRLLTAGAAFALLPRAWAEAPSRLTFRGSHEQGGLVLGQAAPGATVEAAGQAVLVSPDGLFCFGIGFDATEAAPVRAVMPDGTVETASVMPVARQYAEQRIDGLPKDYVEPPPEIMERIARERDLARKARERETDGMGFSEPFDWPCAGWVTSVFGSRRVLNGTPMAPHLGVDIGTYEGTPIRCPADGIVTLSEEFYIEGGTTLIDHGHGVSSSYLHQSQRFAAVGDKVKRGDVIGLVGKTGRATGPHCHWGLAWFQLKLDPSRLVSAAAPPVPDAPPVASSP